MFAAFLGPRPLAIHGVVRQLGRESPRLHHVDAVGQVTVIVVFLVLIESDLHQNHLFKHFSVLRRSSLLLLVYAYEAQGLAAYSKQSKVEQQGT